MRNGKMSLKFNVKQKLGILYTIQARMQHDIMIQHLFYLDKLHKRVFCQKFHLTESLTLQESFTANPYIFAEGRRHIYGHTVGRVRCYISDNI